MIKISGYSDDIISFEGDIDDEIGSSDKVKYLGFSDGTLLKGYYGGIWKFNILHKGSLYKSKEEGSDEDDTNDIVCLGEGVKWCVIGDKIRGAEENKRVREDKYVAFSDGTVIFTLIDNQNVFRQLLVATGSLFKTKVEGSVIYKSDDAIFIEKPIDWCIEGKGIFISNAL